MTENEVTADDRLGDDPLPQTLKSSHREFVVGMLGFMLLFMFTIAMASWLVSIQIIREENSDIFVTAYPDQYSEDKVVYPCAVASLSYSSHPNTFKCNYTDDTWIEIGIYYRNYKFFFII